MGTSLEILAPYLPYGIEVETRYQDVPSRDRGIMAGLSTDNGLLVAMHDGPRIGMAVHDVLPVLYSFEDLCTPLPDGTVPAVEVAKLAWGLHVPGDGLSYVIGPFNPERLMLKLKSELAEEYPVTISHNYNVSLFSEGVASRAHINQAAILDYLRSKHFAVGLTADQYTRKGQSNARH